MYSDFLVCFYLFLELFKTKHTRGKEEVVCTRSPFLCTLREGKMQGSTSEPIMAQEKLPYGVIGH